MRIVKKNNEDPQFYVTCDLCSAEFRFGTNVYNGKHLAVYGINICNNCYQHDGCSPSDEKKLLSILKSKGIAAPQRNQHGLYPWK